MAEESTQKWLGRNRPPRVHITYDLETRGAIEKVELPLVVGILADLAGAAETPDIRDQKFVEIDRDNFNDVMKSIGPKLTIGGADIQFANIDDFTPDRLVQNVKALKDLLVTRQRLNDLLSRADGQRVLSDNLYDLVEKKAGDRDAISTAIKALPPKPTKPPEKPPEKPPAK